MHPFSIFLVLVIGCTLFFVSVPLIFADAKGKFGFRWVMVAVSGMLVAVGIAGFFGSALCSLGGLNWLGNSFEWPVGLAKGVITLKNGTYAVPHTPSGRVQLYDQDWKFQKGWQVDASGGTFKLRAAENDWIEVITARGQWRYLFHSNGQLLSKENYSPASYGAFPESGDAYFVPTASWLWTFTHPFYSWGLVIVGIIILSVESTMKKNRKRARKQDDLKDVPSGS